MSACPAPRRLEMHPEGLDAIRELINIGVGRAAASLNGMLDSHIDLTAPVISMASLRDLQRLENDGVSCVALAFRGDLDGVAALLFPPVDALKLITMILGEEPEGEDLDALRSGTLTEIGNIVINAIVGTISNLLRMRQNFELPVYLEGRVEEVFRNVLLRVDPAILIVKTFFNVRESSIEGSIIFVFELHSFDELLSMAADMYRR